MEGTYDIHNFMIVLLEGHLDIQSSVFSKMPVGIAVLGAEDRPDFVYSLEVGSDTHLLRKLGTLREKCGTAKILDGEDTGSRFSGATLELGRVYFNKSEGVEVASEDIADTRVDAKDRLRCWTSEIHDPMGKSDSIAHESEKSFGIIIGFVISDCMELLSRIDGEWNVARGSRYDMERCNLEFQMLYGGPSNFMKRFLQLARN